MKAIQLPINNFLQAPNVQFVIPVYQRNYDWTTNECKTLIEDVVSVEKDNRGTHFIGSIVFIHEGIYSTSEVKELVIIDGQQRLTTINILYVALFRFAKKNGMVHEESMLYNSFLTNQFVLSEESKLKLKQTDNNSNAFKAIMNGTEREYDHYSNVIENFNFFESMINTETFHTILNGLKRLIFVEISLERDKDDPQRIFESLNSTGLDLTQSDLIRNFILMDLDPKDQNRIFEQIWNPIEENAKDLVKQKSMVSDYLRDYLTLKNKKIPNKNSVYVEFKKRYANKTDGAYHQDLENIKSLSIQYKKLINPQTVSDVNLRRELEYITRLEINVAYPFLLQVFEDADNGLIDQQTLIKILKLIQSYTWRRFIVNLPTGALNKIFMVLYADVDIDDYYDSLAIALMKKKGNAKFPTNQDLRVALKDKDLYNTKSKNRNYLFELLENHNNREYVDTSNSQITIEHIFPQNPGEKWRIEMQAEEFSKFKDEKLNTIANLTLSGNNGSLSNASFAEKKGMNREGGEQGYRYSRLWLNVYLKEIEEWNLENYDKRFDIIYDRFVDIWQYPDIDLPETDVSSEQNIFNAESPKHQQLEYFIFENTKEEEDTIAQMYMYIIRKLYKKNPELMISNDVGLKISRSIEEFRAGQEVVNGYFIETNLDSLSKFNSLKRMLTLFELEDELIIKYVEVDGSTPNRFVMRKKFWNTLLPRLREVTTLYDAVNANKDSWLQAGAGKSGITYLCAATKAGVRVELVISTSDKPTNKRYYHQFEKNKEAIEMRFDSKLNWQELPEYKLSLVTFENNGLSLYNESDWTAMCDFFCEYMPKLINAFEGEVLKLKA